LLIATGTILLVGALIFFILASDQYWQLQFELNDRLPEGEKFEPRSWLSWPTGTWSGFRELQRRVLPNSSRPRKALQFALSGLVLFVSAIVILFLS
jgi:hypothetical protein